MPPSLADNTLGIGFVGAGWQGHRYMAEFSRIPSCRIAAVYDPNTGRAEAAAHRFPGMRSYPGLQEMLSASAMDAVVITTLPPDQRHVALACAERGQGVLLETPMSRSLSDADTLLAAAEARPEWKLIVARRERFNHACLDARKAVEEGKIGEPRFATVSRLSPVHLHHPHQISPLGPLESAIADFDLLLWLMGDRPAAISAQGISVDHRIAEPDHVSFQIRFEGGALAQGHAGWIHLSGGYPLAGSEGFRMLLVGTGGAVSIDRTHRPVAVYTQDTGHYFWPDDADAGYGGYPTTYTAQAEDFLLALRTDRSSLPGFREAHQAFRIACAARQALGTAGPVALV